MDAHDLLCLAKYTKQVGVRIDDGYQINLIRILRSVYSIPFPLLYCSTTVVLHTVVVC